MLVLDSEGLHFRHFGFYFLFLALVGLVPHNLVILIQAIIIRRGWVIRKFPWLLSLTFRRLGSIDLDKQIGNLATFIIVLLY